jgi:hypothetical protein
LDLITSARLYPKYSFQRIVVVVIVVNTLKEVFTFKQILIATWLHDSATENMNGKQQPRERAAN